MAPQAVTESASAAERETASQFLPTDRNYRLTGELPEGYQFEDAGSQVRQDETPPKEEEASAPSQEVTSDEPEGEQPAASQAAPAEEHKGKTQQTSESRWAKLSRENRELRERLARLEGRDDERQSRDSKQTSQPAKAETNPEPRIDDADANGKPKYKTWDEFQTALRKWDRDEATRLAKEEFTKTQREQAQTAARQRLESEVNERVAKARKDHSDYDDVTASAVEAKDSQGRDLIYIPEGSHLDFFFLDSPRSQDVFYAIGQNLDKYAPIFARDANGNFVMPAVRQLRELAKIENSLESSEKPAQDKPAPPKPITQAGRPPQQTSGKGSVQKDAVQKAIEEGDTESYMREQNAKALAARKRK